MRISDWSSDVCSSDLPAVHGGILAVRDDAAHVGAMEAHGIGGIDLVVVNLYPFAATVAKGAPRDDIIENIDIGGPAMVRSAAKNHAFVGLVTDPEDYDAVIEELEDRKSTRLNPRQHSASSMPS